jgi:hypothetical protein
MLRLMPFRLAKRLARGSDATVLGTYFFSSHTVQVLRAQDERIEWTCDCEKFLRQGRRETPLWCKHIAKAAARRSLERLTARRVGIAAADGPSRGAVPEPRASSRPPPSGIAPGDLVMPR